MRPLLLAALCAVTAHGASSDEADKASRLESRVEAALERMLGPGRAALTVEIKGERAIKKESSTINRAVETSGDAPGRARVLELPGYTKSRAAKSPAPAVPSAPSPVMHSLTEETEHAESFAVTGVRAWLVLDSSIDETRSAEAARVAGEMLALDPGRGDDLSVIRTAFHPAWRAAFSRPRDARLLLLALLLAASALAAAYMLARGATRAGRAVAEALRDRVPTPGPTVQVLPAAASQPAPRPGAPRRVELLPPLGDARAPGQEDAS